MYFLSFLFFLLPLYGLLGEVLSDQEKLLPYCHHYLDENGQTVESLTVEASPDNQLLIMRKVPANSGERESDYYFNSEGQLLRIHEISSEGVEKDASYETIDAVNDMVAAASETSMEKNFQEPFQKKSACSLSWSSAWQFTQIAAKSFAHQLSVAASYLSPIRHKLSLAEQMKEPIDRMLHLMFSNGFLQFCGYYQEEAAAGCSEFGTEISDRVRVTFINGMLNIKSDMQTSIQTISETHGGVKVHYVFKPTEGWTHDLFASFASKMGIISVQAELLAQTWRSLIEEMGGVEKNGRIIHYAHSIGAADTYVAKELLTPEEQSMINVVTLGSPSLIMDDRGFANVKHYVSKRDGVSMIIDPVGYLSGLISEEGNISLVGTYWGVPFIDHTLFTETYFSIIESLGKDFVREYSN